MLNNEARANHEAIYENIVVVFKLKFKSQLKDSGIYFTRFLSVKDMITEKQNYTLFVKDTEHPLIFEDYNEFIDQFIGFLRERMNNLNQEFDDLNTTTSKINFFDENFVNQQHERIGSEGSKASQLLKKFYTFKNK